MFSFQNETKQTIEVTYSKMTEVEKSIADFFIDNKDVMDFSSKYISKMLYISEACLLYTSRCV